MSYHEVYFYIHCPAYHSKHGVGFQNDEGREAFNNECIELLQAAGWELAVDGRDRSGHCCEVSKGKQSLYLHPQHFSGIVLDSEIEAVTAILRGAKTFRFEYMKVYTEYFDMTDEEYLSILQSKSYEIAQAILERFRTKRRNLFISEHSVYDALAPVRRQFGIKRIRSRRSSGDLENGFIKKVFQDLTDSSAIINAPLHKGDAIGYRSATPKDKKQAA